LDGSETSESAILKRQIHWDTWKKSGTSVNRPSLGQAKLVEPKLVEQRLENLRRCHLPSKLQPTRLPTFRLKLHYGPPPSHSIELPQVIQITP
jgi:hypothetical protein